MGVKLKMHSINLVQLMRPELPLICANQAIDHAPLVDVAISMYDKDYNKFQGDEISIRMVLGHLDVNFHPTTICEMMKFLRHTRKIIAKVE
jgi:hypothetical protein